MNVVVIRHGKVDFKWRNWSTSEQFDMDCMKYDKAPVKPLLVDIPENTYERIYISSLSRSRETAIQIFGEQDFIVTKLIDEVPLHSSIASKVKLPLLFWNISGRLQWLLNNHRQQECRKGTIHRAEQFVQMLLHDEANCIVITHGFFMHIVIDILKKNGFCISHTKLQYSNGEYITAER
ncbi:MAG: histidine phosphatase [Acetatifactor sp.]|nr:histidine phosphatase [Acetatifactor sp.]